jgi:tetratricopeptide (TPR) repeat protein
LQAIGSSAAPRLHPASEIFRLDASLRQQHARFEADPDATAAFEVLEEHFFMTQGWNELAALYRRRLEAPSLADDAHARAKLLFRLGQVLEESCSDVGRAIEAYQDAVRLAANLTAALRQLRQIYTERGSWETVLQIAELETATPMSSEERARLFSEMGDIWQRELGDAAQASNCYERAREEAAATDSPTAPADDAVGATSLVQKAWLAAARGDASTALEALRRTLESDPADVEGLDMMATVLEGVERYAEMTDFLERRAALATDPETRGAVLARLGAVREEHLADLAGARSAFERALSADPSNVAARLALVRIYRVTEAWPRLRTLLEALIAQGIAEEPAQVLCELGELLETQFDDAEAATSAYEEALALAPNDERAQNALVRLHESAEARESGDERDDSTVRLGDKQSPLEKEVLPKPPAENRAVRVEGVLERKLAALDAKGEGLLPGAVSLRLRIADLRGEKLDDLAGAIAVLEPALESDAALPSVAERLAELYEHAGRHPDLAQLSQRVAGLVADPDRSADWYRRAAETARNSGDAALAVECYGQLLEVRPRDRDAKAALLELHRSRGDVESLSRALHLELARASQDRELDLRLELVALLDDPLANPAGALLHLRRALELAPDRTELLDQALHLAQDVGGAYLQLDLLDHLVETASGAGDCARLLAMRGDLMTDVLGWREEGTQSWQQAVSLDPNQLHARARLQA